MKKSYAIAWSILSCLTFSACRSKNTQDHNPQNDIIYLEELASTADATAQFRSVISQGKVLVDFFADWCRPCKQLNAELKKIAQKYPSLKILKVDVEQFQNVARSVRAMPTIKLYKNGQDVHTIVGFQSAQQLSTAIEKYLN